MKTAGTVLLALAGVAQAQAPQYPPPQPDHQPVPAQPSTPGYPLQQTFPPPGCPQPQAPGYPQQQAYPQQGYPQEAAPQPRCYPPGPACPPPPAAEPQHEPPAGPATRRGLLFLPYVGFSSTVDQYSGDQGGVYWEQGYSPGLRVGALLGVHIGPFLSLNGELGVDIMNPDAGETYNGTADRAEASRDFTLSPLFHFGVPNVEFAVGPKIGWFTFAGSSRQSDAGRGPSYTLEYDGHGMGYGVNAGAFVPIGRMALGGIISFTGHSFSGFHCSNSDGLACTARPIATKLISFSVAILL